MKILVDDDVAKVAEFMLGNCRAPELYRVACAINRLAEMFWKPDNYPRQQPKSFTLEWGEDLAKSALSSQRQDATALR
jgi:hypothetical protein